MKTQKAQVWIETAIYSLIGLTIIAILLTAAMPQIEKMKDKAIISQTTTALNELDNQIIDIMQAPGNIRIVYFKLSKGNLEINSNEDKIIFTLEDTKLELSEVGTEITEGNIKLKTEKYGRNFKITLTLDYSESLDLTYKKENKNQILQSGTTDYKIKIENPGTTDLLEKIPIDIDIL
jgi:type II secretory pathway pseudopilin PulG